MSDPNNELFVNLGNRLYRIDRPWGAWPDSIPRAAVSQIAVDSNNNLYVIQRGDPPVIVFKSDGSYLRSWGSGQIADPHGIFITSDDRVCIVDRDAHQVLIFDLYGQLKCELGERGRPRFRLPFNHPTGVAVASDGEIYVSDGYGNSRVHRFSAEGVYLSSWGEPGNGPGQFTTPHAVWVTRQNQVLVADRENNRIQVFERDGTFVRAWSDHYHPMDIWEDQRGMIYVTDQIPRLSMLTPDGDLVGRCRPVPQMAHGIWGDALGNLYCCETSGDIRISRLTRIADDTGERDEAS